MTLDFTQLAEQVRRMGLEIGDRRHTLEERLALARRWLAEWSEQWEAVWTRVNLAKDEDAKYRGASPIGRPTDQGDKEPMAAAFLLPPCPDQATLITVDGSQIYPDPHAAALYYLLNMGVFVVHHGTDAAPTFSLHPQLFYHDEELYTEGHVIRNAVVNARRTIAERKQLADTCAQYADEARPLLAVVDGPLLFWVGSEVLNPSQEEAEDDVLQEYLAVLARIRDKSGAALVGYVDRPTSTYVIRLLHLLSLEENRVNRDALMTNGELEGLNDVMLFGALLEPGQRSALFVQRSPTNKKYALKDPDLEIAFFYVNTALPDDPAPYLARVEMPMWAARDRELVGQVQALLYDQCRLVGRYPYMLARADELAVVQGFERRQLNTMIEVELRRQGFQPEPSEKAFMKTQTRDY